MSIFIAPPSLAAFEERLRGRGQDSDAVIGERMAKARDELSHWNEYEYLVVNDQFAQALGDLGCILTAERLRTPRQATCEQARLQRSRMLSWLMCATMSEAWFSDRLTLT